MKKFLIRWKLTTLIPVRFFIFLSKLSQLSKWISKHKELDFSDFPHAVFEYQKRYELYDYVLKNEKLNNAVDYLEFGVAKGYSFQWWVEHITHPQAKFFGFDTFTGLPEDWGPFKEGKMSTNLKTPQIDDARCKFIKGLFQDTLFEFLENNQLRDRKIIHLDADLYTSTLFVLTSLSPYLKKNDILFFDEFNVPRHEFNAFNDWTKSFYIKYEVVGEVNNFHQIAIKLS